MRTNSHRHEYYKNAFDNNSNGNKNTRWRKKKVKEAAQKLRLVPAKYAKFYVFFSHGSGQGGFVGGLSDRLRTISLPFISPEG